MRANFSKRIHTVLSGGDRLPRIGDAHAQDPRGPVTPPSTQAGYVCTWLAVGTAEVFRAAFYLSRRAEHDTTSCEDTSISRKEQRFGLAGLQRFRFVGRQRFRFAGLQRFRLVGRRQHHGDERSRSRKTHQLAGKQRSREQALSQGVILAHPQVERHLPRLRLVRLTLKVLR